MGLTVLFQLQQVRGPSNRTDNLFQFQQIRRPSNRTDSLFQFQQVRGLTVCFNYNRSEDPVTGLTVCFSYNRSEDPVTGPTVCFNYNRSEDPVPGLTSFTSPGIYTRKKGPTAFNLSSKRHRQSGVNETGQVSKCLILYKEGVVMIVMFDAFSVYFYCAVSSVNILLLYPQMTVSPAVQIVSVFL